MTSASAESSTPPDATPIRAEDCDERWLVERRRGRNRTKADLAVYRSPRGVFAVKDYGARPWAFRHTLGRWLIRRESRAYAAAAGAPGLPRFRGRIGPFALAVEWIDARPLADVESVDIAPERFDRLAEVVAGFHERGVALSDMHYRDILLHEDGRVWVIDLAAACVLGNRPSRLRRRLFEHFSKADRFALARLRARFGGGDPADAIAEADPVVLAWHRRARRLKWRWDKLRGVERLPPVDDHWKF